MFGFLLFCFVLFCLVIGALVALWVAFAVLAIRLFLVVIRSILWFLPRGRR